MPEFVVLSLAAVIIAAAVYGVARGIDVRLCLIAAAFALAALTTRITPEGRLTGQVPVIVREFLGTFSNEKFVVPICTAMGFAYVLRHTGCDLHLVRLLTRPLRSARLFLIPGVVLVGFLVNIPVISQTSTAVCIGAVVVPLMRAGRLSSLTIGSTILLGASIGGELLNPGAPELNTVANALGIKSKEVVPAVVPLVFTQLAVATAVFWFFRLRAERGPAAPIVVGEEAAMPERVNLVRALVPLVPLALLFLTGPPFNRIQIPHEWVGPMPESPANEQTAATRQIGLAMMVGVLAAAAANPRAVRGIPRAFFEGAGYAFAEIVSLIVAAVCFGKAVELVGVAELIGRGIEAAPGLLVPSAGMVPLAFAALSGSGMASTQSLYHFFVEPSRALGVDPKDVGALVSLGAAAGRTMSPVAAVTLMSAKLTGTTPFALARIVAGPLLVGMAVVIILRMAGAL